MSIDDLIREVAAAYKNPEEGEADRNGNTRLSVLRERFHLSSLKIQKILVTAGVYEPVKGNTAFETVSRFRELGMSAAEIVKATGLSAAAVAACFPYERAVYNADRIGAEISADALRKRRQRNFEERKRLNAVEILQSGITDESFWRALKEHDGECFISTEGEKFSLSVVTAGKGDKNGGIEASQFLQVESGESGKKRFSREEILSVLHKALERKAFGEETGLGSYAQASAFAYVYPLLVVFGVIPGDRAKYAVRRMTSGTAVCACCGRRADYTVRTYADLVRIAEDIEEEERSRWDPKERERVEDTEASFGRTWWEAAARKENAAIRAFNAEGERELCEFCAQTIRMALADGELPQASSPEDLSGLSPEAAKAGFDSCFARIPDDIWFEDRYGRKYASWSTGDGGGPCFLIKERDTEGTEHSFVCTAQRFPGSMSYDAWEVHRLTRAGKHTRSYTGTDYEFHHGRWAWDEDTEEEKERKDRIGFLELANKIRGALRNPSLEWHEGKPYFSNMLSRGGRQCALKSTGEMQVNYVDEGIVQGRSWEGGQIGFRIDGIIFTGEEVARMSGTHKGWNLQYRFADPSGQPLKAGEYLMPVRIGEKELVTEVSELLNLFAADGRFISEHDRESFGILFEKMVLEKLKFYYRSRPAGYGKLAGMQVIKRLMWVEGTEKQAEQVRRVIQD